MHAVDVTYDGGVVRVVETGAIVRTAHTVSAACRLTVRPAAAVYLPRVLAHVVVLHVVEC